MEQDKKEILWFIEDWFITKERWEELLEAIKFLTTNQKEIWDSNAKNVE